MVRQPSTMALVEQFAAEVVKQTDSIWRGDHRTGNKHAKRYIAVFQKLRAMGDAGRDGLATLLTDERLDVRVMAAAYLLRHRTTEAMGVLATAAKGTGFIAFEAGQAIERWDDGTWALDPPDEAPPSRP